MDPKQKQPQISSLLQTPPVFQPEQDAPPPPETIIEPRQGTIPEPPLPPPPPALSESEPETDSLPPLVSPPAKKKGLPKALFGIAALLLLVVSIPVGVFLVKQSQELRSRANEAADCDQNDRGGLKETAEDCDVNTNQLVQVFVCNNNDRLAGSPTGQECPQAPAPPQEPAPAPVPSDQDGPGGCCTPGATDNSAEGCRKGNGFNEVCDIANGACQSGSSCRSLPGTGCEQNTDCGPGNECKEGVCKPVPPPSGQYTSCASWGWSDDPDNTANPNCEKEPINGFSCRRTDGVAVCAYKDGTWQEGQQGNCESLGNGTIKLNVTTQLIEYHCPNQTSSTDSCSENRTDRGRVVPGTYTVGGGNCGGHQIDATGYCGSYVFRGACAPPPQLVFQCTAVKFYDTNWDLISNPQTIAAGQTIRMAVVGSAGIKSAEFRINSGAWERAVGKNANNELYIEKTITAGGDGRFSVEARVYN